MFNSVFGGFELQKTEINFALNANGTQIYFFWLALALFRAHCIILHGRVATTQCFCFCFFLFLLAFWTGEASSWITFNGKRRFGSVADHHTAIHNLING